jgi:ubiquinone/menaquinone biosynthesis C-methylase UbiE
MTPTASQSIANPTSPDLQAIKLRQQLAWSTGDYGVVGTGIPIAAELLCEAIDLRSGERVLDVATGHGNAALAAARRYGRTTGVDYVPALLERAKERAAAERLTIEWLPGDAEELPFPDASFDVVLSTFGAMFAPDQPRTARELARVCKPGGRIGMANWTPDSFVAEMFRVSSQFVAPPAGLTPPATWGDEAHVAKLFGPSISGIRATRRELVFRYRSFVHWLDVMRTFYGPMNKTFAALAPDKQAELARELESRVHRLNRSGDESFVVPSTYLELVITRAGAKGPEIDC